jgi:hypothetical protein
MAFSKVTVNVPDVQLTFKSGAIDYGKKEVKASNVNTLKRINSTYGTYINRSGSLLSIPNGVISGFIATESSGHMVGPNKFEATGLMQATPPSTYDAIASWKKEVKDPIPAEILQELSVKAKFLINGTSYGSCKAQILNLLKTDASFNILAGCMILRWMFERFSNNGTALFNRALISYNAGAYTSTQLSKEPGAKSTDPNRTVADTATLVANVYVPKESRNYLVKMLGVDGFLDLIYRQNLV